MGKSNFERFLNQCLFCEEFSSDCKTCSRCFSARYCSKVCQVFAHADHKKFCKQIKRAKDKLQEEENKLKSHPGNDGKLPWEKEENVGCLWGKSETFQDWCRWKLGLGDALVEAGQAEDNFYAFQVALDQHLLEILRLDRRDEQNLRFQTPFLLLVTGQYQRCYDFISWYINVAGEYNFDWNSVQTAAKGEWFYPEDEDRFNEIPGDEMESPHLLAMILLKFINIRNLIDKEDSFPTTELANTFRLVLIDEENKLMMVYIRCLEKINPFILPIFVKTDPDFLNSLFSIEKHEDDATEVVTLIGEYHYYFEHFSGCFSSLDRCLKGLGLNYNLFDANCKLDLKNVRTKLMIDQNQGEQEKDEQEELAKEMTEILRNTLIEMSRQGLRN